MTTVETRTAALQPPTADFVIDDAQIAAAAFLARYSGRTFDAHRHDILGFFQWTTDNQVSVLAAMRPNIELARSGWVRRFQ